MSFRSILAPTDFSAEAQLALDEAARLARACGAELTIVHVHPGPGVIAPDGFVVVGPQEQRDLAAAIERSLGELRQRVEPLGLVAKLVSREGSPAHQICALASEGRHDLVVLGSHGRTGIARMLIGSVAERVVRGAPCSVLVVRGKKT